MNHKLHELLPIYTINTQLIISNEQEMKNTTSSNQKSNLFITGKLFHQSSVKCYDYY